MKLTSDPAVQPIFEAYPNNVKPIMDQLRELIISTAGSIEGITDLVESLKWGEPSYRSNCGSTVRIDWKAKAPEYCAIYFQCTTSLVSTFRTAFGDELQFAGKRAIILNLEAPLPKKVLSKCLAMALNYHKVKHLPLLGI